MTQRLIIYTVVYMLASGLANENKSVEIVVEQLTSDLQYLDEFINCLLDKNPCTEPHFADFKEAIPEIVKDACGKCDEKQKSAVSKVIRHLYESKPDKGIELNKKYDPESKYAHQFEMFLSEN